MGVKVCYVNPTVLVRRPISELLTDNDGLLTPQSKKDVLHHEKGVGVKHTYRTLKLPFVAYEWPVPLFGFFKQAQKVLKEYDIIHIWAHFYLSNLILVCMNIWYKKRIIITIDTLPGYSFQSGTLIDSLFRIYTWTFGRLIFALPDAITLYGKALIPAAKQSGFNMKKVRVIPTGIKEYKINKQEALRSLRKELNIPKGRKIVLFAGILNHRKRPQQVLEVAKKVDATFLIAGDGPLRLRLEKEAKDMDVKVLGWRKDLPKLIAAADVFLFPSSAEGLPGVVMEAMSIGTPVVTTKIPCTTDLIGRGEGILCAVDDTECFTRNIQQLLDNNKERNRLARNAHKKINQFSWKKIRKIYTALYEELL